MVLRAIFLALLSAATDDHEPAAQAEPEPIPAPPPPRPANADIVNGFVVSAERLVPLVSVHDMESERRTYCEPGGGCFSEERTSDLTFGFESGALRSLFDLPGIAFDGAVSGFTFGASLRMGATGTENADSVSSGFVRTERGVAVMPRAGYAVPIGSTLAIWPRIGTAVLVQDDYADRVEFPIVTADVATVLFFASHAAFTLTPSVQQPMRDTYARRLGLDAGVLLAF